MKEEILYSILRGHFVFYDLLRFCVGEKEVKGLKGCDRVCIYIFATLVLSSSAFSLTFSLFIYIIFAVFYLQR